MQIGPADCARSGFDLEAGMHLSQDTLLQLGCPFRGSVVELLAVHLSKHGTLATASPEPSSPTTG